MLPILRDLIFDSPAQAILLWSSIALLILIFFLEPGTLLLSKGENGQLQISRRALHRLLEACCMQLKGVASARAEVVRRKGKLNTSIRLKIYPDAKLDAIQGYLNEEITDIFKENLGIAEVGTIDVKVTGVVSASKDEHF